MRRSRYVLIGFLPLLILATPFVWSWIAGVLKREAQFRESRRLLDEAVAELDRADPGWRWADFVNQVPRFPEEENRLVHISRIKSLLGRDFERHPSGTGYLFDDIEGEPNQLYDAETIAALGRHQARYVEAVALARKLETFPTSGPPFRTGIAPARATSVLLSLLPPVRNVVTLLRFEVDRLAIGNRPEEALPLLRAMLAACDAPGEHSMIVGHLTRDSCWRIAAQNIERLLGLTEPGEELRTLLEPLRRAKEGDLLYSAIRGERAHEDGTFHDYEQNPEQLRKTVTEFRGSPFSKETVTAPSIRDYEPFLKADHASTVRRWTAVLEALDRPLHERAPAVRKVETEWPKLEPNLDQLLWFRSSLAAVSEPRSRTEAFILADQRALAALDGIRTVIACELFRLREKRWPQTLSEIPKDLLPEIPLDPFDGKPLRYRVLTDGIAVWSVGETFLEDPLNPKEGEEKPRVNMVFRAWNPDKRRMPAPPPRPELLHDPIELDEERKEKE